MGSHVCAEDARFSYSYVSGPAPQTDTMNNWKCHHPEQINWPFTLILCISHYFSIPFICGEAEVQLQLLVATMWNKLTDSWHKLNSVLVAFVLRPKIKFFDRSIWSIWFGVFELCGHRSYFSSFICNNLWEMHFSKHTHTNPTRTNRNCLKFWFKAKKLYFHCTPSETKVYAKRLEKKNNKNSIHVIRVELLTLH